MISSRSFLARSLTLSSALSDSAMCLRRSTDAIFDLAVSLDFRILPKSTLSLALPFLPLQRAFVRSWRHVLTLACRASDSLALVRTACGLCFDSEMERRRYGGTT